LLFIACLVMLAHSFIPHTHHQDHICVTISPCYKQQAYSHSVNNPEGEHHGGQNYGHSGLESGEHHRIKKTGEQHDAPARASQTSHCNNELHGLNGEQHAGHFTEEITRKGTTADATTAVPAKASNANHCNNEQYGREQHSATATAGNLNHCNNEQHGLNGEPCDENDPHCHTEDCQLSDMLVFAPAGNKLLPGCPCSESKPGHPLHVQAILSISHDALGMLYYFPFRQKPYLLIFTGHDHGRVPGLRAPPVS
jgi:hypothetical protein